MAKEINRTLAGSFYEFANRLKSGRGFWDGNKINCNPADCRAKRNDILKLAEAYERNQ